MDEYLSYFMNRLCFPEEAKKQFLDINTVFEQNENYYNEMNLIISDFFSEDKYYETKDIHARLKVLAQKMNINVHTVYLIFYIYCSKILREKYEKKGIPDDIFWNSMLDLRCKLMECYNVHGIWGTFVESWFRGFYTMQRFGLGRLQYEDAIFPFDSYTRADFTVQKGDKVYNVHIPSSGPLTREERMASYKKAYEFYKKDLKQKPFVLVCESWLLYPGNREFLPEGSNIVDFMNDFEIIDSFERDEFLDGWRVFGRKYKEPVEQLPAHTSLQRAFVDWLRKGNKTGIGYGIMLFDGENII